MKVKPAAEMCDSESQPVSKSSPELTPPTGSDRTKKSNVDQDVKELQTHAASMNAEPSRLEDSDKGPKEIKDRSHFEPPVHAWSGHHILVHSLRSDTFLRQALTSPYNQRTERHGVSGASPLDSSPRDTASACSSSPRMEGGGHAWGSTHLEKGRWGHHEGEYGVRTASVEESPVSWDHLPTFKTPKTAKRWVWVFAVTTFYFHLIITPTPTLTPPPPPPPPLFFFLVIVVLFVFFFLFPAIHLLI